MEKFLLRGFLAADELDIVHQQHVGRAVFVVKFRRGVVVDGADDLVGKFFTVHVYDVIIREIFMDFKLDGAEKVRFAQARTAPDEQWVISAGWIRRNGLRGCVGKLVGGADDEVFKRKFIIAAAGHLGGRLFDRRRDGELHIDVKTQQFLERLTQKVLIARLHDALYKIRAHGKRGHTALKGHWLDAVDEKIVSRQHKAFLAVLLYSGENLVE